MRRRIEMGERWRTRSREESREKRKRSDRPAVEMVGYVSILFLVLVLESSQSGVSTRGETLFLLLLLLCKGGRGGMTKSQAIVNTFSVVDWCSGGR